MATKEQIYKVLVDANPNFGKVDMDTAFRAASKMNPAWGEAIAQATEPSQAQLMMQEPISIPDMPGEAGRSLSITPEQVGKVATTPGVLPAATAMLAAPLTGGMSAIPAALAIGAAAAGGEAARQGLTGKLDVGGIAKEGALGALGEGAVRGTLAGAEAGINAVKGYAANSPRLLSEMARFFTTLTKKEVKPQTVLEAMQRPGMAAEMTEAERIASEAKFAKEPASRNMAMTEKVVVANRGAKKLGEVQTELRNLRTMSGKMIEKADTDLAMIAKAKKMDLIDLGPIAKEVYDDIYRPMATNPILKDAPGMKQLETKLAEMAADPAITIEDAIKTKKLIAKIYEDFGNKGVMAVPEVKTLSLAMTKVRQGLDKAIKERATAIGYKDYEKVYKSYGEFANNYDTNLLDWFGSKEGHKQIVGRFNKLSGEINTKAVNLDMLKGIGDTLPNNAASAHIRKQIKELSDELVLHNLYTDIGSAPSSWWTGLVREYVAHPAIKGLVKVAQPTKTVLPKTIPGATPAGLLGLSGMENEK